MDERPESESVHMFIDTVISQTFEGTPVTLDGKHFIDCSFTDCVLNYSGGPVSFERTQMRGCRYVFFGEARATVQFLQAAGLMPFDPAEWMNVEELVY